MARGLGVQGSPEVWPASRSDTRDRKLPVSTVLPNCRAKHLARSLLKAIPVAIHLTPPSGFCNASTLGNCSSGEVFAGREQQLEQLVIVQTDPKHLVVHPGQQPAGASRRHFANAFESNWRGLAGWKSNTSRGIADTGSCGRRP